MREQTEIERLAALVHQAYLDTCARLGWDVKPANQVPYDELTEDSKELDRASVRAVLAGIQQQPPTPQQVPDLPDDPGAIVAWRTVKRGPDYYQNDLLAYCEETTERTGRPARDILADAVRALLRWHHGRVMAAVNELQEALSPTHSVMYQSGYRIALSDVRFKVRGLTPPGGDTDV